MSADEYLFIHIRLLIIDIICIGQKTRCISTNLSVGVFIPLDTLQSTCCLSMCKTEFNSMRACLATFSKNFRLISDKKPYKCTKCAMAFSDVSTCNRHIRRHEIKELREKSRVPCQLCSYKCTDIEQLKSHLLR